MSLAERRQKLLEVLCLRRCDTYDNLAREFNVSKRTIRYDVAALMCSYPIETSTGPYGGVKVADWYHNNHQDFAPKFLTQKQFELLLRLKDLVAGDDLDTLNSIINQFAL